MFMHEETRRYDVNLSHVDQQNQSQNSSKLF